MSHRIVAVEQERHNMSPEMEAAVRTFENACPHDCAVRRQANPIYTLITVKGWPRAVHYEFRDRAGGRELYVELHIEDPKYVYISEALEAMVAEIGEIDGFKLHYFASRPSPHRKKWPSASIEVPKDPDGKIVATVMRKFIAATRKPLDVALDRRSAS
jgi:hypothetical protein